jgi:hypothetical protein
MHDESVKISNTTAGRSSALCASDATTSVVILTSASLLPATSAAARVSPSFSVPSAFLCVKSFAFRSAACPQDCQFLFDTNEPLPDFSTHTKQTTSFFLFDANVRLSRAFNFAIHTKQITSSQISSLFLFDTNERS